uniref:Uncharacterized protein n=1 Tax=Arundo donax TaxID=35708 RepID=A0A0A9B6J5_ARUDO
MRGGGSAWLWAQLEGGWRCAASCRAP